MARIIRIMTRDGAARAVFAETRSIVDEAARIHHTAPTATAARSMRGSEKQRCTATSSKRS